MTKEERVCQFYKLSVRKNGDVFPCCLGKKVSRLGNIFDEDITEKIETSNIDCECALYKTRKILPDDKMNLKKLHLMFSHECQAHCVCCNQHKDKMENEEEHLEKILDFVNKYKPEYITVLGGEVLVQPATLNWIESVKNKYPEILFDIVTNLCVGEEIIKRVSKIFSEITVSFLGFTPNTYNSVMGLDYDVTIKNFDYLLNNTSIKMRPKYLAMPTNVYDLPLFFEWALNKNVDKIYLHNTREFAKCCHINDIFWQKTFAQIEKEIKKILEKNKEYILNKDRYFISFHSFLAEMLKIDEEYLEVNGFKNIIKITS